jgi:hypothetical protein
VRLEEGAHVVQSQHCTTRANAAGPPSASRWVGLRCAPTARRFPGFSSSLRRRRRHFYSPPSLFASMATWRRGSGQGWLLLSGRQSRRAPDCCLVPSPYVCCGRWEVLPLCALPSSCLLQLHLIPNPSYTWDLLSSSLCLFAIFLFDVRASLSIATNERAQGVGALGKKTSRGADGLEGSREPGGWWAERTPAGRWRP